MSNKYLPLNDQIYDYLQAVSLREHDALRRLRAETAAMSEANMQIAPEQGQLMALLVQLLGARRTLEVGVFTGYSSLAVALALPPEGRVVACDVSEEWTRIARRYWREAGVADKIDLRLAPALDTLDQLLASGDASSLDVELQRRDSRQIEVEDLLSTLTINRYPVGVGRVAAAQFVEYGCDHCTDILFVSQLMLAHASSGCAQLA